MNWASRRRRRSLRPTCSAGSREFCQCLRALSDDDVKTLKKLGAVIAALDGAAAKAPVCRNFGMKCSTLLDSLARIGWSPAVRMRSAPRSARRESRGFSNTLDRA